MELNVKNVTNYNPVGLDKEVEKRKQEDHTETKDVAKNVDSFEMQHVTESVTYEPPKKLTQEQIEELNRKRLESTLNFVREAVEKNVANQAKQTTVNHYGLELSTASADFLKSIFGSLESAYPPPATTPEGALANISPGGSYSVESVSERIMHMATTIAAGNPDVLAEMEEAVKKGFEAAGFDPITGGGMPDITRETYDHVMGEFAKLKVEQSE